MMIWPIYRYLSRQFMKLIGPNELNLTDIEDKLSPITITQGQGRLR